MINEWRGIREMANMEMKGKPGTTWPGQPRLMDADELAMAMLQWKTERVKLDALEEKIKTSVLAIRKTQVVGTVKARYNSGRKKYDYASAARDTISGEKLPVLFNEHTTKIVTIKTDWRSICEEEEIGKDSISYTQGDPSVSLVLE